MSIESQQAFEDATKLLAEGKWNQGALALEEIIKQGATSADIEANLGRALVESGKSGEGLVHLFKSVSLERFASENRRDLEAAQAKVPQNLGTALSHPSEWGWKLSSYVRAQEFYFAGAALLLLLLMWNLRASLARRAKILGALGVVAIFALGFWAQSGSSLGFTLAESELRPAPLASANVMQKLPEGTRLRIIQVRPPFAEVERPGALRGWVEYEKLFPLKL